MVWDEDRRKLTEKEAGKMNLSFSTDDEFYKATRGGRERRVQGRADGGPSCSWVGPAAAPPDSQA